MRYKKTQIDGQALGDETIEGVERLILGAGGTSVALTFRKPEAIFLLSSPTKPFRVEVYFRVEIYFPRYQSISDLFPMLSVYFGTSVALTFRKPEAFFLLSSPAKLFRVEVSLQGDIDP